MPTYAVVKELSEVDSKEEFSMMNKVDEPTLESGSSSCSSSSEDVNKGRGNWTGKCDFLLSCIGYAVGLGNIWRFPYLCYNNGGGAFLIPYFIFAMLCGVPLFLLELTFGQFASQSPIAIWKVSPLFKGLGYGMVVISGIVCIYYNIIIAWTLYYMFESFSSVLPWSGCNNAWNTDNCVSRMFLNESLSNSTMVTTASPVNATIKKVSASEEFWVNHVLHLSDGIEDLGEIQWKLLGCLFLAWVVVFLCLFKGVKSSGRVVYFSATFPYLVLIILLVRGLTLPGSLAGITYYLTPRWDKLWEYKVWGDAATQIFYSMGPAWGGLITMASYNKFHNNCYRDALLVPVFNCGTSIFAGFVVFSIIGFMAHETGRDISDVVAKGPGLAFIAYPEAVTKLPISPLWAFLFFLMLFTVGLDSQFGMFETMVSAFIDEFPALLRQHKLLFTVFMCVLLFLLGIPCVTQGGMYVLQLMDWYSAAFSLMLISLCECLVIAWIYKADRFMADLEMMVNYKPRLAPYWKFMWKYVTPTVIFTLLLFTMIMHTPVTYQEYVFPGWAVFIGWVMALCSILPLPIVAIIELSKRHGTLMERLRSAAAPSEQWGPALDIHRIDYKTMLYEHGFINKQPLQPMIDITDLPQPQSPKKQTKHDGLQYESVI